MNHSSRTPRSPAARTFVASGAALVALTLFTGGLGTPAGAPGTARPGDASVGPAVTAGAGCGAGCAEPRP